MRCPRAILAPLLCASCTFGGLGNYPVETCPSATGATTTVQGVGALGLNADLAFASANGGAPYGAYVSGVGAGTCVQAVGTGGYISPMGCAFFAATPGLSLRQPWVTTMGAGRAVAAVATTAPCTQGQIRFEYDAPSGTLGAPEGSSAGPMGTCDATGASLPSLAPLGDTTALVAWYQTALTTRSDPLQSCEAALAAPLVTAVATVFAGTSTAAVGPPATLTARSVSIRPPAVVALGSQVIVAAPADDDVGVWALDGNGANSLSASIPGLKGARAVSIASDGAGHLAVVAEIGCSPQSIALSTGTLERGFGPTVVIAARGGSAALQPTVAWVPAQRIWIVSWISVSGGAHALVMRFDLDGGALGPAVDPGVATIGATVTPAGALFAYEPDSQSFVDASLGCAN